MEPGFESGIIIQPFFWFINIVNILVFLCALALGYRHGARYVLSNIGKVILHFGITVLLTIFLTENTSLFSEKGFYEYLEFKWRQRSPDSPPFSQLEANKLKFLITGFIYFFVVLIVMEVIIAIIRHFMNKKKKDKEKKPISKTDRVCGEILGAVLFIIWAALPAPLLISAEKTGFFTNGTDLINKTVMTVPVNYVVKPILNLIAPESKAARLFEDGLEVFTDQINSVETWTEEQTETGN